MRTERLLCAAALFVGAAWAPPLAPAADVTLAHSAVERLIWRVLLTEDGRGYLEGAPGDTCRYAFVQEPRVSGSNGRLRVRFLFAGRAGAQVGERCVGPGDTFDIVVSGIPALTGGVLHLEGLRVEAPDTANFRLVRGLVESELNARMRYPLRDDLNRIAATVGAPAGFTVSLDALELGQVQIDEKTLRLSLDLDLGFR